MGKINDEDLEDLAKSKIVEQRQELEKVGRGSEEQAWGQEKEAGGQEKAAGGQEKEARVTRE